MPGPAPAASNAHRVARRAWRGLIKVLTGPDAPQLRRPWQRRAYLALSVVNLASMHRRPSLAPPRVLVPTTFDLDDYVYEALRAGASRFLLKTPPPPSWSRRSVWQPPCWPRR